MKNICLTFKKLIADESGQDLIEYALIAALIGLAAIASLRALATSIQSVFSYIQTQLGSAIS
ncbi:MAG: Flp family type IVb pilin [Acidobacteriaceae bacterium]|nr:Flp family type IVb pilin [Acidobacteriaceae bacterium]